MLCNVLGQGPAEREYATAGFYRAILLNRIMAADRSCTTIRNACDRTPSPHIIRSEGGLYCRLQKRPGRNRICRGKERCNRIPVSARAKRSLADPDVRIDRLESVCDRCARKHRRIARGQSRNPDHSRRLYYRARTQFKSAW
jgi:hypothetical protein